ncbi:class I SAM-dependent methyltransferase [Legionella dresdenensis]|uniref:Class I SAM-dependent methyltransferase n=1 Tax=Legionella dresdenensis TaxID=450200 RepID=A0ABV8CE10_9GAMM
MPQKNWNPHEYDKQSVLQYNTAMSMLNTLPLKGNEKILDIGCGTGRITSQIARERLTNGGSIIGLDINEGMIDYAKNNYVHNNLSFECKNVLDMDHEESFDLVISFWTLSWIPLKDQADALQKIIQSLNEDGNLFLMYPLKHDAYEVVTEVIKRPHWQKYFQNYAMPRSFITEEQYKDLILSHIPMDISVQKKEIECRYTSDQEMVDSINCWLAHVDEISEPREKNQFLWEVAEAYKAFRGISTPAMFYSTLEITGCKNTLQNNLKFTC